MVRWAPRLAWAFVLVGAIPLGCSGPSPAGSDSSAPIPCFGGGATCPIGTQCLFTGTGGCTEAPHCVPEPASCNLVSACTCTNVTIATCVGASSVAIRAFNACEPAPTGPPCDGGCCSGPACELCDASGYSPGTMWKPALMPNACTAPQISDFMAACLGSSATQQTCSLWQTAEAEAGSCLGCLLPLKSSSGPLVCTSTGCDVNTAGCIDLVLGQESLERVAGGTGSCGDLISDSVGCAHYACTTCDTTGPTGDTDYDQCTKSALGHACLAYAQAVDSLTGPCGVLNGSASPPEAVSCFPQTDTDVPKLLNVFCGTGP